MEAYYVAFGDRKKFDSGFSSGFIRLDHVTGVRIYGDANRELAVGQLLPVGIAGNGLVIEPTTNRIGKFSLSNLDSDKHVLQTLDYLIPSFPVSLNCLDNRTPADGRGSKSEWKWGRDGHGAILMVRDEREIRGGSHPTDRLEKLEVRDTGLERLDYGLELRLYCTRFAANRFSIYRPIDKTLEGVLGRAFRTRDGMNNLSAPLSPAGEGLRVTAHQYPDGDFEGLITIELHLRQTRPGIPGGVLLHSDKLVLRVAPWLALSNSCVPSIVYICEFNRKLAGVRLDNKQIVEELREICDQCKVLLFAIPKIESEGDRWIQDEVEFGFSHGYRDHTFAIFQSPRGRGLRNFAKDLVSDDTNLELFRKGRSGDPNDLDSFGNLDASPPVTVDGTQFPFGRIVFGGRAYGDFTPDTREMMPEIRKFLYAQKVQAPFEVYTDWLRVGHVDEIISFVPYPGEKQFRVLIGSPALAHTILRDAAGQGYGKSVLLQHKLKFVGTTVRNVHAEKAAIKVDRLLRMDDFWEVNLNIYQQYMNLNRTILQKYLGLRTEDIVDIPALFTVERDPDGRLARTSAFFPAMVNQLVIGSVSIVPKPFGPTVGGQCLFEKAFRDAVPARTAIFLDDWLAYHVGDGEIHCGTNALRQPNFESNWWDFLPRTGFDVCDA